jgi:predicted ATP-dependent endonuclease of OLD family
MSVRHLIIKKTDLFKDYFLNDEEETIKYIPSFNTINIIVGSNNSGKSRFMRNLMSINDFEFIISTATQEYNILIDKFNEAAKNHNHSLLEKIKFYGDVHNFIEENYKIIQSNRYGYSNQYKSLLDTIVSTLFNNSNNIKRYYIPTLRTAHSLYEIEVEGVAKTFNSLGSDPKYKKISKDVYFETLNKYYNLDNKIEVFTGMHLYKEILNSRNSEKSIRNQFESFEKFLSKNFFDGNQIDIVAKFNKDENEMGKSDSELILIHVQGEEETRKLHDLGDGIQAIIILMYKIFMAAPNSYIYIDEPELHLHPGMQRLFLDQICSNKELKDKNLTYIITTHSNHFLDLSIEKEYVSIYTFSPRNSENGIKNFSIKNVNAGDNQLLRNLGVNNSSVFMANCSIWVEGVSDRNYIKAFLKAYIDNLNTILGNYHVLKEDIDFAFFEYAGSNIDHYIFDDLDENSAHKIEKEIKALALSNKIFLLADSDLADGRTAKGKRLKTLEAAKKDNFMPKIIWGVREIENLLTPEIWNKVLINFCNKDLLKTNREEIEKKIEVATSEIDYINFKTQYIGEYLNQINLKLGKIGAVNILNQSVYELKKDDTFGTFIPKRQLSEFVLNEGFGWDIFKKNKSIVELTEEIYSFITTS